MSEASEYIASTPQPSDSEACLTAYKRRDSEAERLRSLVTQKQRRDSEAASHSDASLTASKRRGAVRDIFLSHASLSTPTGLYSLERRDC